MLTTGFDGGSGTRSGVGDRLNDPGARLCFVGADGHDLQRTGFGM